MLFPKFRESSFFLFPTRGWKWSSFLPCSFLEISIIYSVPAVIRVLSHQVPKPLTVTHETLFSHMLFTRSTKTDSRNKIYPWGAAPGEIICETTRLFPNVKMKSTRHGVGNKLSQKAGCENVHATESRPARLWDKALPDLHNSASPRCLETEDPED